MTVGVGEGVGVCSTCILSECLCVCMRCIGLVIIIIRVSHMGFASCGFHILVLNGFDVTFALWRTPSSILNAIGLRHS